MLIEADTVAIAAGGAGMQRFACAGALESGLDACARGAAGFRRGGGWQVCVADALLRYLVVEWPAGLRGRAEREAFLAHRFREVHGVQAPEWRIAAEGSVFNELPVLACAMPQTIVDALQAWAVRHDQTVCGVTGEFADAFNRQRERFDAPTGAYAHARAGRLTIGAWQDGAWRALRSQVVGEGGMEDAIRRFFESRTRAQGPAEGGGLEAGILYCGAVIGGVPSSWQLTQVEEQAWA